MGLFSILEDIGEAFGSFCSAVWKGLKAVWGFIKKVVSTLFSWTVAVIGWLANLAADVIALILAGVIITFIWIFGLDDDYESETQDEKNLGKQIGDKLGKPHKKIVIKGVFNKNTKEIHKATEIEATEKISAEVKAQTGSSRFVEIQHEE